MVALSVALLLATAWPAYAETEPTPSQPTATWPGRSLERLQAEAAAMQADFAVATIAYTTSLKTASQARAAAEAAERKALAAKVLADLERRRLGQVTAQVYQMGIPTGLGTESMLWSLSSVAENLQEIADRQTAITVVGNNQVGRYQAAMAAQAAAAVAAAKAVRQRAAADKAALTAKQKAGEIQRKSNLAVAAMQDRLTELSAATQMSEALQQARNALALDRWRTYLTELTSAGVVAPKAATVRNPARLPTGLAAAKDTAGKLIAGTAEVVDGRRKLRILPAETISAVSTAFGLVGKPYGIGGTGPDNYGCLGAARAAWRAGALKLPKTVRRTYAQYREVPRSWLQYGDLVLIGDKTVGLHHIGIAIDNAEMIAADEATGAVVVTPLPVSVYAVTRPTLGAPKSKQAGPPRTTDAVEMRCGAPVDSLDAGTWVWPLPEGSFQVGASFGQAGPLWTSGLHTGQDFSAPLGTAVRAVTRGTVYVERPGWAGNLIRIDHGDGIETWYAHLSSVAVRTGQTVVGGQLIGAVGSEGNSTGPHLHFEAHLGGEAVNPMPFLATGGNSFGWGGFTNGMILLDRLCPIGVDAHLLRCDAAAAYRALAKAYYGEFGRRLCITDSYRSYPAQVTLYAAKPTLAALPGTSNHGWGMAVDLCGGIHNFGTAQHKWMLEHAGTFGWAHPRWARQGGSRPEPWHWEFARSAGES